MCRLPESAGADRYRVTVELTVFSTFASALDAPEEAAFASFSALIVCGAVAHCFTAWDSLKVLEF